MLLLDEPLSALDAKVRVQLREEIRRIQTEVGTTTLFVTHDQEEALAVADRVGVMRSGRLEQIGAPARCLRAARHAVRRRLRRVDLSGAGDGARRAGGVARGHGAAAAGVGGRADVAVLVRPEAVVVVRAGDGSDATPAATGDVVSTSFLGALARVSVATPGGLVVAQLSAGAAGDLAPGTAVTWRLLPAPALAVPA